MIIFIEEAMFLCNVYAVLSVINLAVRGHKVRVL